MNSWPRVMKEIEEDVIRLLKKTRRDRQAYLISREPIPAEYMETESTIHYVMFLWNLIKHTNPCTIFYGGNEIEKIDPYVKAWLFREYKTPIFLIPSRELWIYGIRLSEKINNTVSKLMNRDYSSRKEEKKLQMQLSFPMCLAK